jgi:hypothetical protein
VTQYSWKSAVSGDWQNPANWSPYGGPFGPAPPPAPFGGTTADTTVFDTGSKRPYVVSGGGQAASLTVSHDTVTFTDFFGGDGYGQSTFNVDDRATVTLAAGSGIQMIGHFEYIDGTVNVWDASFIDKGSVIANQDFGPGAKVVVDGPKAVMIGATSDIGAGSVLTIKNGGSFFSDSETINGIVKVDGPKSIFGGSVTLGKGSALELSNGVVGGTQFYSLFDTGADVVPSGGLATVDKGAYVVGNGTIYPNNEIDGPPLSSEKITNDGSIIASGGTLKILGAVVGSGRMIIAHGSTLELEGDSSNNVVFLNHATLMIDTGVHETGFLQGFGVGDRVDLLGQTVTSFTTGHAGLNTILDLYDGSAVSDQLTFKGQLRPSEFDVAKNSSGGTTITLDPHAFHAWIPAG